MDRQPNATSGCGTVAEVANPLCGPLRSALLRQPQGITEYELLNSLRAWMPEFVAEESDSDRRLFLSHFLLMNALYRLEPELHAQGWLLEIEMVRIRLVAFSSAHQGLSTQQASCKLRAYYLDLRELDQTRGEDVRSLLQQFWQRYLAHEQQDSNLVTLGVEAGESWEGIQFRYRQLARKHHPDRGGDAAAFRRIRNAYEALKRAYGA